MYIGDPQTLPMNKISKYLLKREEKVNLFTDIFNQYEYPDPVSVCTIKKIPLWKTIFNITLDIFDPTTPYNNNGIYD